MKPIKGAESLFFVKKNDVYYPVGCLTSSPLSEDVAMVDTTTRENNGWKTSFPTNQGYSIELSGLMVMDDDDSGNEVLSYRELRRFKRDKVLIDWERRTLNGYYIDRGKAWITTISDSDEADGFITFNASLVGQGAPIEDKARIYVLGNVPKTEIYAHKDGETLIQTK